MWWLSLLIVDQHELLVGKHGCEVWFVAHLLTMSTFGALNHLGLSTVGSFVSLCYFWLHLRFLATSAGTCGLLAKLHVYAYSYWILFLILERERLEVPPPAVRGHCWSLILPLDVSR